MVRRFLRAHPHSSAVRHNPTPEYRIDYQGDDRVWIHGRRTYNSLKAAVKAASGKLRAVNDGLFNIEVVDNATEKTMWSERDYYRAHGKSDHRKRLANREAHRARERARHNPIKTKREGRVLHPENCDSATTQRLLSTRKAEGRRGVKHKTSRIGKCDYRSASYALAHHSGGGSAGSLASRILPWWPSSK